MICESNGAATLKQTLVNSSGERGLLQPRQPGALFFFTSYFFFSPAPPQCFGNMSFFDTLFFIPSVMLNFPNTLIILSPGARCVCLECCKTSSQTQLVSVSTSCGMRGPSPGARCPLVGWHPCLRPPTLTGKIPGGYRRCP